MIQYNLKQIKKAKKVLLNYCKGNYGVLKTVATIALKRKIYLYYSARELNDWFDSFHDLLHNLNYEYNTAYSMNVNEVRLLSCFFRRFPIK